MEKIKKCKLCGIPLNSETVSKKDPLLCYEDAEEPRQFTAPSAGGAAGGSSAGKKK